MNVEAVGGEGNISHRSVQVDLSYHLTVQLKDKNETLQ